MEICIIVCKYIYVYVTVKVRREILFRTFTNCQLVNVSIHQRLGKSSKFSNFDIILRIFIKKGTIIKINLNKSSSV